MILQVTHDEDDLRFYAPAGEEEAELTYTLLEDGVLDLDYTYIPEEYRNQGLADQLVKAALDFVQAKNLRFVPSCPVVEAYAKRHPAYQRFMAEE
ncbi:MULTISPECIES: GNAT family N-acetyltransferase [Rufibacter]|uniref:N-acetyltransferase domain-containing protein n=1 Tax=Rufibacter quisquiliarum TaxID=1549639 RepID=A0A839G9Y9_9BACT|nr:MULTISPECIES: GNAT family N-acetyltransferase [Rufibacter]MBA9076324.1 hypothetical protein [Rufibacter quisquiliarum]